MDLIAQKVELPGFCANRSPNRTTWVDVRHWASASQIDVDFTCAIEKEEPKRRLKRKRKRTDPDEFVEDLLVSKVKLSPNAEQRTVLKRWIGAARFVYNKVIEHFRSRRQPCDQKTLRQLYVHNAAYANTEAEWMLDVPYDIRDGALQDALKARQNAFLSFEKTGRMPTLNFRSKKDPSESVYLCFRNIKIGKGSLDSRALSFFFSFLCEACRNYRKHRIYDIQLLPEVRSRRHPMSRRETSRED